MAGWPTAVSDRPYTLDKGILELHGALPISGACGDTTALLGFGAAFKALIPVVAGGWFAAAPKVEIGASITDDLKDAGNNYFFELGARVFM